MRLFCCSASFDVNWTYESKSQLMTLNVNSREGRYLNDSLPKELQISNKYRLPHRVPSALP